MMIYYRSVDNSFMKYDFYTNNPINLRQLVEMCLLAQK